VGTGRGLVRTTLAWDGRRGTGDWWDWDGGRRGTGNWWDWDGGRRGTGDWLDWVNTEGGGSTGVDRLLFSLRTLLSLHRRRLHRRWKM